MMGEIRLLSKRAIFLDGLDTGLGAYTKNDAVATMLRVMTRRGHSVSRAALESAYSTSRGRIDFVLATPTEAADRG